MFSRIFTAICVLGTVSSGICAGNGALNDTAEMSVSARQYLDEVFAILESESLFKDKTDWTHVKSKVFRQAVGAEESQDTYEAIVIGLALIDHHSFLIDSDRERVRPPNYVQPQMPLFPDDPRGLQLDENIAYLLIPGHSQQSEGKSKEYAEGIQSLMKEIDSKYTCGWIIDLRTNPGGNLWPMIESVASLLEPDDTGRLGAWTDSDGEILEWWGFRNGKTFGHGEENAPDYVTEDYEVQQPAAPVAILIGDWTASSGEFLGVAFIGRPKTAIFGRKSGGFLTGNEDFELSDGATLYLATVGATDRFGRSTGNKLKPDFEIDHQPPEIDVEDDKTIGAARDWIKGQSECVQNG